MGGEEGPSIAAKVEGYARVWLASTIAASHADADALIARMSALQTEIWRSMKVVARRSPNVARRSDQKSPRSVEIDPAGIGAYRVVMFNRAFGSIAAAPTRLAAHIRGGAVDIEPRTASARRE